MRLLPVIHRWTVEANKIKLVPITVNLDAMHMQQALPETVKAFNQMAADAQKENVRLKVIWGFRSLTAQQRHFEEAQQKHGKRKAIQWVAPPGYSEHHTGWVLDLGDESDPKADDNPLFERTYAFRWLKKYASRYGFELSFQKGNWQGVGYEPWHWRFVGTPNAQAHFHPAFFEKTGIWLLSTLNAFKCWLIP